MKKSNNPNQVDLLIHLLVQLLEGFQQCQHCCSFHKGTTAPIYEEYTDSADTMKIMKISESTLLRYRKQGLIEFVKRKGKIYYLISSFYKNKNQ